MSSEKISFKVRVFTTPSCIYCVVLKEFLKENKIEFEEIDVSKDDKAREEMIQKSGQLIVPVMEIDSQIVIGFDRKKVVKLLNIKD